MQQHMGIAKWVFVAHTFIFSFTSHGESKIWENTPQESLAVVASSGSWQLRGNAVLCNSGKAMTEKITGLHYKTSQTLHSV